MLANKKPSLLIVEDDLATRDLARAVLEADGYVVFFAASARDAISAAAVPDRQIDILITDSIMAQMPGRELANRIASIKPSLKVLFASAYGAEVLTSHNLSPEGADCLRKPYTADQIRERVAKVMASGRQWRALVAKVS